MQICPIESKEIPAAFELLPACGWRHRLPSLDGFVAPLAASQRSVVAVEANGNVVAFARAITDGLSNGYLSMIAVAPTHRGKGVGRALVEAVTAGSPSVTWLVRAGREGAAELLERLGFQASQVTLERARAA